MYENDVDAAQFVTFEEVVVTPVACNFVNNSSALPMRPVCIIPMFF